VTRLGNHLLYMSASSGERLVATLLTATGVVAKVASGESFSGNVEWGNWSHAGHSRVP
jgi:hypothetical protein